MSINPALLVTHNNVGVYDDPAHVRSMRTYAVLYTQSSPSHFLVIFLFRVIVLTTVLPTPRPPSVNARSFIRAVAPSKISNV